MGACQASSQSDVREAAVQWFVDETKARGYVAEIVSAESRV